MSRILLGILFVAALIYAVYLLIRGKTAPDLTEIKGWRWRFRITVALTMAFLGGLAFTFNLYKTKPRSPSTTCYAPILEETPSAGNRIKIQALWLTLDPSKGEEFRIGVSEAVQSGDLDKRVEPLLVLAYKELAYHKGMTRHLIRAKCYEPAPIPEFPHREAALAQLEALDKIRTKGTVSPEVLAKAEATLVKELRALSPDPKPKPKNLKEAAHILVSWKVDKQP